MEGELAGEAWLGEEEGSTGNESLPCVPRLSGDVTELSGLSASARPLPFHGAAPLSSAAVVCMRSSLILIFGFLGLCLPLMGCLLGDHSVTACRVLSGLEVH